MADWSASVRAMHVAVLVLGDVGRSPRMQYHALSLLQQGHRVSLVGYDGEALIPDLQTPNQSLNVVRFTTSAPKEMRKFRPFYLIWRLFSLLSGLVLALYRVSGEVDCVLVQNPPAVPLLLIAYLYCKVKNARFVIDWHNLGYSMFSAGTVQNITEHYEQTMAPLADGHLCVTKAMKEYLETNMRIMGPVSVLYDCPPAMFHPLSLEEQHDLFVRLKLNCRWLDELEEHQTLMTEAIDGKVVSRYNRPALVTSSTSWTEDEDFGILLDALVEMDSSIENHRLLVLVTGKGPMKAYYEEKVSKLPLQNIVVDTLWLEPDDYPKLLACADVGVSLHTSTSGKDLPMKVLDLFGCQTPVCALGFDCLGELVEDDYNGRIFQSSGELKEQLLQLLDCMPQRAAPHSFGKLRDYSENLRGRRRWNENWDQHAKPILLC